MIFFLLNSAFWKTSCCVWDQSVKKANWTNLFSPSAVWLRRSTNHTFEWGHLTYMWSPGPAWYFWGLEAPFLGGWPEGRCPSSVSCMGRRGELDQSEPGREETERPMKSTCQGREFKSETIVEYETTFTILMFSATRESVSFGHWRERHKEDKHKLSSVIWPEWWGYFEQSSIVSKVILLQTVCSFW